MEGACALGAAGQRPRGAPFCRAPGIRIRFTPSLTSGTRTTERGAGTSPRCDGTVFEIKPSAPQRRTAPGSTPPGGGWNRHLQPDPGTRKKCRSESHTQQLMGAPAFRQAGLPSVPSGGSNEAVDGAAFTLYPSECLISHEKEDTRQHSSVERQTNR